MMEAIRHILGTIEDHFRLGVARSPEAELPRMGWLKRLVGRWLGFDRRIESLTSQRDDARSHRDSLQSMLKMNRAECSRFEAELAAVKTKVFEQGHEINCSHADLDKAVAEIASLRLANTEAVANAKCSATLAQDWAQRHKEVFEEAAELKRKLGELSEDGAGQVEYLDRELLTAKAENARMRREIRRLAEQWPTPSEVEAVEASEGG